MRRRGDRRAETARADEHLRRVGVERRRSRCTRRRPTWPWRSWLTSLTVPVAVAAAVDAVDRCRCVPLRVVPDSSPRPVARSPWPVPVWHPGSSRRRPGTSAPTGKVPPAGKLPRRVFGLVRRATTSRSRCSGRPSGRSATLAMSRRVDRQVDGVLAGADHLDLRGRGAARRAVRTGLAVAGGRADRPWRGAAAGARSADGRPAACRRCRAAGPTVRFTAVTVPSVVALSEAPASAAEAVDGGVVGHLQRRLVGGELLVGRVGVGVVVELGLRRGHGRPARRRRPTAARSGRSSPAPGRRSPCRRRRR